MRNILFLSLWAMTAMMPARSDALPVPTSVVTCTDVFVIEAASACQNGGATASLSLLPFVGEQIRATAPATDENGPHSTGAFADIQYAFEVLGGQPGDLVPVLFTANLDATASSDRANGFASIFVLTGQGNTQFCVVTNGFGCPTTAFSGTFQVMARSGDMGNRIELQVSAGAGSSPFIETASASADPLIFVDPGFPRASLYSIALSPGVGNGLTVPEPVPEPATPVLMSAAALGLALATRRRRKTAP